MFKEGDRVQYIGEYTPSLVGRTGTVVSTPRPSNVAVYWDGYKVQGVIPESLILLEGADDELPPAPESVLYINQYRWGIQARVCAPEIQVGIGDPSILSHGWSYASMDADTALQLCHDLRRMAMQIKREQKDV